jgi:PAS domain S-box-containing protein
VLLVAAATGVYRARIRALQANERELKRRVEEQTADLQKEIAEHKRTEERLAQENEERQRAEEEARQAAAKLKEGNAQLLEQRSALERENRERRRAEQDAGRERDLMRALMDNIPDLIYFKDDEGRFVRVNAALAEAVGAANAEAVVGRADRDFFSAELAAETAAEERELLRSGRVVAGRVQYDSRSRRWYLATKVPIRSADGRRAGLVGVSKDITERKLAEERLEQGMKAFLEMVSSVAQGDLTRRAEEGDETLGRIARSTNGMLDAFAAILGEVRDAALAVSSSSTEIMAAATQIAKGAQYGSDQVVSTLAAVEQMAASMSQVARHAASSSEKAHQVLDHVQRGDEATNVTNAGMARIDAAATETAAKMRMLERRSREIFEIIDLIEDLSAQSTLLSLNAAIEAAHAGEAGRGFAVVADEVRRLADRSKEATAKVSAIVAAMVEEVKSALEAMEHAVKEVKDGRALSAQAIESLGQIKALVRDSSLLSDQITLAAREQAAVTGTVVSSMQTIANVTQESAVGATSTSTAVQDLVRMSEQLMQAIARFRVGLRA